LPNPAALAADLAIRREHFPLNPEEPSFLGRFAAWRETFFLTGVVAGVEGVARAGGFRRFVNAVPAICTKL